MEQGNASRETAKNDETEQRSKLEQENQTVKGLRPSRNCHSDSVLRSLPVKMSFLTVLLVLHTLNSTEV